jgi:hypothetical protein
MRASDIHIEPMGDRVRLRYRIDGVCIERDNLPKRMQNAVLSRFKLMAGMNIAEKRIPQDGRIKIEVDGTQIDFRVSACPAYHGESVVLRILRPDVGADRPENLGFEEDNLEIFNKIIRRPTASSSSPARPVRARRRRCTRRSTCSTARTRRSSRPRTRSSTTSRASTSARCARTSG